MEDFPSADVSMSLPKIETWGTHFRSDMKFAGAGADPLASLRMTRGCGMGQLLHAEVAVDVDDQRIALNLNGVNLEAVEGDFVAGGGR